jgi:hypothetical protein
MMVIAYLKLELHDDGAMSIEGNVSEYKMCRNMLDAAHSALHEREVKDNPAMQTKLITDTGGALASAGRYMR